MQILTAVGGLHTDFKNRQFARETDWFSTTINQLPSIAETIPAAALENGLSGIWFQPVLRDDADKKHYQLILDVEDGKSHGNIAANIKAGQGLYIWLTEHSLDDHLKIILTGHGFRFVWPYVVQPQYSKAFLTWIDDPDFKDCIDPKLQTTKKMAVRLLAYRGHSNQGGTPLDVHTHVLPNAADIMKLDAAGYQQLTAGKVSKETFLYWLNDGLLPSAFAPSPWIDLFEHFDRKRKLRESIIRIDFPQINADRSVDWNAINGYLSSQGITSTVKSFGNGIINLLNTCPMCGKSDGHPFISQAGRLKCHHANSCNAGAIGDDGHIRGLAPHEWIPGYTALDTGITGDSPTEFKSIADVREDIRAAIHADDGDYLITASPGSGKTGTTLREILPMCRDKKILYIAPTKELDGEVFLEAFKLAKDSDINITWLKGRNKGNCNRISFVNHVAREGYSPGLIVCPSCKTRKEGNCEYRNQFNTLKHPGLFISTHAQSKYLGIEEGEFDLIVCDENPIGSFLTTKTIGFEAILKLKTKVLPDVQSFFEKMQKAMEDTMSILTGKSANHHARLYGTPAPTGSHWETCSDLWDLAGITEEEKEAVHRYLATYLPFEGETVFQWQKRLYYNERNHIDLDALKWLLISLGEQRGTSYIKVDHKSKRKPYQFVFVERSTLPASKRIVILDGTGDKTEVDSLFGRDFKLIAGNVELPNCKRVFIQQCLGKTKTSHMDADKIEDLLKKALEYIGTHDRRILIGTHQIIEDQVKEIARRLLPNCELETVHYWAGRGINAYQDFDAFIGFGSPTVSPSGTLDISLTLFSDPGERDRWTSQQGANDLIQTIHRIRPVNGNKKIILMGRSWPVEIGKPDLWIDLRRGEASDSFDEAYTRIKAFVEVHRFITKEIVWCLGVGEKSDSEMVRTYFDFIFQNPNSVQNDVCYYINNILLSNRHHFGTSWNPPQIVILSDKNSWRNILDRLKLDFPEIPTLQYSSQITGGRLTDGFGSLEAARRFYQMINRPFAPESWRGEEMETQQQEQKVQEVIVATAGIVALVAAARERRRLNGGKKPVRPYRRITDQGLIPSRHRPPLRSERV